MPSVALALTLMLIPTLMSPTAWGQEEEKQLQLGFEVSFFAHSAPELTLRVGLQRADWQAQLEATRTLEESPYFHISTSQSLEQAGWKATAETSWEMDAESSSYSVQLGLERRDSFGELTLSLQLSPPESTWTLKGWAWNLKISQLRWQGGRWALEHAELTWTLSKPLTLKVGFDGSKDLPLRLDILWRPSPKEELSWTEHFSLEDMKWLWRAMELGLRRGPLSLGSYLPLPFSESDGWQESRVWVEAEQALRSDLAAHVRVRWGPGGWLDAQLTGRWHDLGNSAQATLDLAPGSWKVQLEAYKIDPDFNVQGKLGLGPEGINSLMLMGRAMSDVTLLDGLFNYSKSLWMLNLSGSLIRDFWELSSSTSWTSIMGFEKGTVGLKREWTF